MNERNRDFPSFFKGQICTFANETEVFHKGYFGQVFLTLFFRGFVPFLSLADFVSRDKNLQVVDFTAIKVAFWRIGNGNHQNLQKVLLKNILKNYAKKVEPTILVFVTSEWENKKDLYRPWAWWVRMDNYEYDYSSYEYIERQQRFVEHLKKIYIILLASL